MAAQFEEEIQQFRPELLAHCYRMTGALSDAEDALQNALVRAWKAFDAFEGRSSLRTWLYKITTNACLDLLASRRARTLPQIAGASPDEVADPAWLEPFPTPDTAYASREAVRLAFVVALQVLPARQRAALILRDVVGLSAEETAETLDSSVPAINSALQRARAVLDEHPRAKRAPLTGPLGELLGKYLRLWEAGDGAGLIQLLRDDATIAMPPMALWAKGPEAIRQLLETVVFPRGNMRLVPCYANGSPAFGSYVDGQFGALTVLDVEGDKIVSIQSFLDVDPTTFGLPRTLEARVDLVPGLVLGRYRLEHVLGSGGMGHVWLAHDTDLDRPVALKVLQAELAGDDTSRARLLREARAMARLRHPNVVTVYELASHGGHELLVMELVDGESLGSWAARGQEPAAITSALLAAGEGLAAAHSAGLVHRDFKPANVMIGRDGRVLVGDFGLARAITVSDDGAPLARASTPSLAGPERSTQADQPAAKRELEHRTTARGSTPGSLDSPLTHEGTVMGTPVYMAPEQLRGQVDERSDIFAFAVSAWELLTGHLPYSSSELVELARGATIAPSHADRLPAPLVPVLTRGLAREPDQRFLTMPALLDAIRRAR